MPTTTLQPYLFFGGRCEEALEFYREKLGAEIVSLRRFKEAPEPVPGLPDCFNDKIMHASVRIGESIWMASDGQCEGNPNFEGFQVMFVNSQVVVSTFVDDTVNRGSVYFLDGNSFFSSPSEGDADFVDDCHMSDQGQLTVAKNIVGELLKHEKSKSK